jgi:L-alanine-DL-glutamate epimerase-like enolase superfamily enzyme
VPSLFTAAVLRGTTAWWRFNLAAPVGGSGLRSVDLVVVELATDDGFKGLGFSYVLGTSGAGPFAIAKELVERHVAGRPMEPPQALWRRLAATLNRLGRGPGYIALAAIDVAAWDLYANMLGVPLGIAMGGTARPVRVYGSGHFYAGQPGDAAVESAGRYLEAGFQAVKPRAAGNRGDRALLSALAREFSGKLDLMVDANEKCNLVSAAELAAICVDVQALFLEEPLPAQALDGYSALARSSGVPIASGEHWQGCVEVKPFLDAGACALIQPDLAMMGGLTECLRVAALAEQYHRPVSPHFLPDLFVHLAAAAPNVAWLEHFPLLEPLFAEAHGAGKADPVMSMPDRSGHGLRWADDIARHVEIVAQ